MLFLCFISFVACVTVSDRVDGIQSFEGFMLDEFIPCKGLDFSSCLCDVTNDLEIVISRSGMMTDTYQSSFVCAWGQELHTKFIGSGLPCTKDHIVRVLCCYPINPGRLSNQCHTGANRCTPILPR